MGKRRKIAEVVSNAKSVNQAESTVPTEKEMADKFSPTLDLSEKIPTKPAGKVDTKQGSALVTATKSTGKMEPMSTNKPGKVSLTIADKNSPKNVDQNTVLGNQGKELPNFEKKLDTKKPEKLPLTIADQKASKPVDPNTTLGDQGKGVYDVSDKPANKPVNPDTVLGNQGQALAQAIQPSPEAKLQYQIENNNTGAVLSNAVLNQATQSAKTSNEVFDAPQVAQEVGTEADKEASKFDEQFAQTVNAYTFPEGEDGSDAAFGSPKEPVIPGDGQTVSNIVSDVEPAAPKFDQVVTKEDLMNMISAQYLKDQGNVPYAVVEKLGVQDYYPNVGRDIGVGTFSGSRIGSQTIYSGAGALLPMGLYDARKRALKDAAKNKQAELDKILAIPDTTPQLKRSFTEYALKVKYNDLARNGFDPARYSRDFEARKNDLLLEATAKDLTYATEAAKKQLEATLPKDGKPGNYMPEKYKEILRELISGTIEDPEAFFSGKKNINKYHSDVKQFADGTVWIDNQLKTWLEKPVEVPVNLKTGRPLNEAELQELNGALDGYLKAVEDGSKDTDSYMTMIKKYYDIDADKIVDDWTKLQGYEADDEMKDILKDYLRHQIPAATFTQAIKTSANNNFERERLNLDWAKFGYKKEQDRKSFWGAINESMSDRVNEQTGRSFNQELAALNSRKITDKKQLDIELKRLYNLYSISPQANITKSSNGSWVVQIPSTSKQAEKITTKDIRTPNGRLIRGVQCRVYNGKTKTWEDQLLDPGQIASYENKSGAIRINGRKLTKDEFAGFRSSASGMYTKTIGHEISKGYLDPRTGQFVALTADNLPEYMANVKVTMQRNIEQPYAKTKMIDNSKTTSKYTEVLLPGQVKGEWIQISNPDGAQLSDEQSGFTPVQAAEAQGAPITSSGSGSSGGEFSSL